MQSTQERLQSLLDQLTTRSPLQQAILAVETLDQRLQWRGAQTQLDGESQQISPETPFFLASIDKLYNATIVLLLHEQGAVHLDGRISGYLPAPLTQGLHILNGVDYTDRLTVRHLLSHTSGLPDWLEDQPKGGQSLVDQVIEGGDRDLSLEAIVAHVREHLQPHFPPQDLARSHPKIRYSDTNYILLIALIEAITGQSLAHVHERLLFAPMNLHQTYFPGYSQPQDPIPDPLPLRVSGRPLQIPRLIRSIRGMYSTASDALAFLRHLVQGDIFQEQQTFRVMQAHWHRFTFPRDRAALRAPSWPIEYGLGLMRFRLPRLFSLQHPMPAVVGHTGSTGCWLFYCPEWELLLAGSVDEVTAGAVPYRIVPKILRSVRAGH